MTVYQSAAVGIASAAARSAPVRVSLGHRELAEADHWILSLDPRPVFASTHLVQSPFPHVAISLVGGPPASTFASLMPAVADDFGRAVIFPGSDALVGTLTVAELLALSAIDRVEILGGAPPTPETEINTTDFVRPAWRNGELILTTTPAVGGRLVPFESRNPTPCYQGH